MPNCLVALGSNVGDRAATLDAAVAALRAAPGVRVVRHSRWQATKPQGGANLRHEFLNGAAVLETTLEPSELLNVLRKIETSHGRQRHERWADRTLDLDLLLYDDVILDTPALVVPHPRMSFRRFVLEPAVEIAGDFVHPAIGWTLARLLDHLDTGADCIAIVSPAESARRETAANVMKSFSAAIVTPPLDDANWPAAQTTWVHMSPNAAIDGMRTPKLSILLDPPAKNDAAWAALARQFGRGPTLRIPAAPADRVTEEVFAAVEAVWPRLGRPAR